MRLDPVLDRVIIRPDPPEDKTESGLHLPDNRSGGDILTGEVLAVGPGRRDEEGFHVPVRIFPGDRVVVPRYEVGDEIEFNGEILFVVKEEFILATEEK